MKAKLLQSYTKPKELYEELYDSITREERAEIEIAFARVRANPTDEDLVQVKKFLKSIKRDYSEDELKQTLDHALGVACVVFDLAIADEREKNKEETIKKWIQQSAKKDEKVLNIKSFNNLKCSDCTNILIYKWSILYDSSSENTSKQVLLFYECPNCSKKDAFFEDGTKWVSTNLDSCLICQGKRRTTITKDAEGKTFIIYECTICKSKQVEFV